MTQPIKYSKHKNSKRVALTIVIVWVVSAAIGSPIMLGLNTSPQRVPHLCIFYNSDFILYSSLSSFYIPCIVMVFLYYKIFKVIHDRARKAVAKKEARLRGIVIENAAQAQRLHQDAAALPQGDKNGNKSLQVSTVADADPMTANTGSGSQPDDDDFDDLPTEAGGDKSPDCDEEATFLERSSKSNASEAPHIAFNGNHDSGYAPSNVEETRFSSQSQKSKVRGKKTTIFALLVVP